MGRARKSGLVSDNSVVKWVRMTGVGTKGSTNANRYSSAGRKSPSSRPTSFFWTVPSRVVNRAAKYAVGKSSVFCSLKVDSSATNSVAGFFWCNSDEETCGRILARLSSMLA